VIAFPEDHDRIAREALSDALGGIRRFVDLMSPRDVLDKDGNPLEIRTTSYTIRFKASPLVPPGEVHLYQAGELVARSVFEE